MNPKCGYALKIDSVEALIEEVAKKPSVGWEEGFQILIELGMVGGLLVRFPSSDCAGFGQASEVANSDHLPHDPREWERLDVVLDNLPRVCHRTPQQRTCLGIPALLSLRATEINRRHFKRV